MKIHLVLSLLTLPLGACATTSFAPPRVNTQSRVVEQTGVTCTASSANGSSTVIGEDVAGATQLINNFVLSYRCAERELANGRQAFQVPAFFAAVAGLAGPSFGLSNDAILASGVAAGILNNGNSYYAPKAKAGVVSSALRSVLCIKTEAVGVSYFKIALDPKLQPLTTESAALLSDADASLAREREDLTRRQASGENVQPLLEGNLAQQRRVTAALVDAAVAAADASGSVTLSGQKQYFEMVSAALFSVESILAERLRDTGSIDTTDTFAKLKELVKQHTAAEAALKAKKEASKTANFIGGDENLITLENNVLQPLLQTCVLQARS